MLPDYFTFDQSSVVAFYQLLAASFLGGSTLVYTKDIIVEKIDKVMEHLELVIAKLQNPPQPPIKNELDIVKRNFLLKQIYVIQIKFASYYLKQFEKRFDKRTFVYRYFDLGLLGLLVLIFYNYIFNITNIVFMGNAIFLIMLYFILIELLNYKTRNFLLSPIFFVAYLFLLLKVNFCFGLDQNGIIKTDQQLHFLFLILFSFFPIMHFIFISFLYRIDFKKDFISKKLGIYSREKDESFNNEIDDV